MVVFRDISEQKAAEQRLATLNKQLQEVSRSAGQAEVATMSNNLGNVLNSVNVSATQLATISSPADPEFAQGGRNARQNAEEPGRF